MTDSTEAVPSVLYHGTRRANANQIIKNGFRRSKKTSYTGTGINFSECMTVAYEYGEFENGGAVLAVELDPAVSFDDLGLSFQDLDRWFKDHPQKQAVKTFCGNVWVVWDSKAIVSVRLLTHQEALTILCSEIKADGQETGYNGIIQDYASAIWEQADQNLDRFPGERERLLKTLRQFGVLPTLKMAA